MVGTAQCAALTGKAMHLTNTITYNTTKQINTIMERSITNHNQTNKKRSKTLENALLAVILVCACIGTYHMFKSQDKPKAENIEKTYDLSERY